MSQTNTMGFIYNPANQTPEQLVEGFVIRKKEFKKVLGELKSTDLESGAQHFLIEGQRGTGKTSLLLRLKYEIDDNPDYEHLLVVQFGEEQYNIFDLCRLWENVAESLEETPGFEQVLEQMDEHADEDDYAETCFDFLGNALVSQNKRLVLLLDNFGDILDRFSDIEQKRLRDIFHSCSHIQLIASSSRTLDHTYKHDKPFFEFFHSVRLGGLNKKETMTLLNMLGDANLEAGKNLKEIIKNQPQRIETIRRLTAGIPRTVVLLFEIFADNSASVFEDLEQILDRVTPLYKHRMDDLPVQQQAIMDAIAMNWDGIGTKEIVERLKKRGFTSKTVSAQLTLLGKNNLVESKNVDKKNKLYFIKERFFNIWYLMRYGRKKNKDQVKWLVRFLEQWCSVEELEERAKKQIACAKSGTLHPRGGYYMAEALAAILPYGDLQHELVDETRKALKPFDPDIERKLSRSDKELWRLSWGYYEDKDYRLTLNCLLKLVDKGSSEAMYKAAWLYHNEFGDLDKSKRYYKKAIEQGHIGAMDNLGNIYSRESGGFESAKYYYEMAVEKGDVSAMNNLALTYFDENVEKAQSLLLMQKAKEKSDKAYTCRGLALIFLWNEQYQESVESIIETINHEEYSEDIEEQWFMNGMYNYFLLLLAKKQYHLALELFTEHKQLKTQFKPMYYALMVLLKDQYPKESLKMGSELTDTVDEVLAGVEWYAEKYG